MITEAEIKRAPMFAVFKGGKGVAEAKTLEHSNTYWVLAPVYDDPPGDMVLDQVEIEGHRLLIAKGDGDVPVEPRIVDDNLLEDSVGHIVSDWDAVLWALNDGFSLMKIPDELDEPHYRMLVLANEETTA